MAPGGGGGGECGSFVRRPWAKVWPWRQQERGRKAFCQQCCAWLFMDRLADADFKCNHQEEEHQIVRNVTEASTTGAGQSSEQGVAKAGARVLEEEVIYSGQGVTEINLVVEAAARMTRWPNFSHKQQHWLVTALGSRRSRPYAQKQHHIHQQLSIHSLDPARRSEQQKIEYKRHSVKIELQRHPLGGDLKCDGAQNAKKQRVLPLGALLEDEEIDVDLGSLFECASDDNISEADKQELEKRKRLFLEAAKGAAKEAFAQAAATLKQQKQQEFLDRIRKKRKADAAELKKKIDSLRDDVIIFPETHVGADGTNEIVEHLDFRGFKAVVTPSVKNKRSELAGGIGMAIRGFLSVTSMRHLAAKKEQAVGLRVLDGDWEPGPIDFQDMVAAQWRWRGQSVLVIGMYLTSSIGMSGENHQKMARLAALTRGHSGPWAAIGDWNAEPRELQAAGWLRLLDAEVITPTDVSYTCTRNPARMLDYVVCSGTFSMIVDRVDTDRHDPGDHYGVRVHLRGDSRIAFQRNLQLAKPFPLPDMPKRKADPNSKRSRQKAKKQSEYEAGALSAARNAESPSGRGERKKDAVVCEAVPQECQQQGELAELFGGSSDEDGILSENEEASEEAVAEPKADEIFDLEIEKRNLLWHGKYRTAVAEDRIAWRQPAQYVKQTLAYTFDEEGARELGARYGAWVHAVEQYYMSSLQIKAEERGIYLGRGEEVRSKKGKTKLGIGVSADLDQSIRWWGTLASYLVELQRCEGKGQRAQRLRDDCRALSSTMPSGDIIKMTAKQKRKRRVALSGIHGMSSGKLHRKTKDKPRCDNEVRSQGVTASDMVEYMDAKGAVWSKKWKSNFSTQAMLQRLEQSRKAAMEEDWAPITTESLNVAIDTMAKSKTKGVEQMGALASKWLPPEAREELRIIIEEVERTGTWPWQLMVTLVSLLRKDAGGDRAIGLLPEVVKLWSKVRSEFTNEWVVAMAGKWDAAIAGNSALKEALVRSFSDEVIEWMPVKIYSVTALWDLAEFYDTLEPLLILDEGLRLGLPARALHLEMLSHLSARLIREKTAYAEPIAPDRSICAGARRGIDFGRVALYAVLERVSTTYEQVRVRSWVDDVTTRMEGSKKEVIKQLTGAGVEFAAGVKKSKLTLPTKSALIGNDMDVVKEVALKLRARMVTVKVRSQAPDLGIDRGHSTAGGKGKHARRVAHADRQVARTLKMARSGRRARGGARAVVQRGSLPRAAYSCKVFGMAPSTALKWRRRLATAIAPRLRGRCLATLLSIEIAKGDPAFGAVFALLDSWMHIISDKLRRQKVSIIWPRIVEKVSKLDPKKRWKGVTGITRAMVNTLLDLGWSMLGPWHWVSDDGEEFGSDDPSALDGGVDTSDLKQAIASTIEREQWQQAAKHYAGGGMEAGADMRSARSLIKKLKRKGDHDKVGAHLACMTGGVWTRQRVADLGLEIEDVTCPRCGEAPETWQHRMWECKCNELIEECQKSKHLEEKAVRGVEEVPCLWLRGILPKSWTQIPPPPEPGTEMWEQFGNLERLRVTAPSGTHRPPSQPVRQWRAGSTDLGEANPEDDGGWLIAAGDASGGEYTMDPRLRRVAWGWVVMQPENVNEPMVVAGARAALGGWRQSVNRGELTALKELMVATANYKRVQYIADSSYVMRGVEKLRRGKMPKTHIDLWNELKVAMVGRELWMIKVESHMSAVEAVAAGIDPISYLGNSLADSFVDGIIERVQVARGDALRVGWCDGIASLIRSRGYATLMAAIEVEPSMAPSRPQRHEAYLKKQRRKERLTNTQHVIEEANDGKQFRCTRCGSLVPVVGADTDKWLEGKCVELVREQASEFGALSLGVQVGHQRAHPSHQLNYNEELGLHYCLKCGCIARENMRSLAMGCGELKQMGKQNLSQIKKGLQPGTSKFARDWNRKKKEALG
ncbi:unnamed protein product [Prorocentrum cordatum]|uniref:Endonuclease/exonuclease/phosphatase domain-containing protein n=1 Tax=Prorocentrum cordatum TaxID=2364126 RepID=A0ABN9QQ29_9DINO|nr:unnamed protein product [Polarella glacialis]